ncbi:Gfo/Idh/MocA family protein [uncultured Devosia sp.]|uniref:Gfo/Idh/MocA family protein n=1 Tax=uncultured Devosia sp. TaxID=211434 RepID=UPI0035CB710B
MTLLRIAIIGYGHISRTRHIPVIAESGQFEVTAIVSESLAEPPPGCRLYRTHRELLADGKDIDAVAINTPPAPRYAIARDALLAGKHVFLEKPSTATLGEIAALRDLAERSEASLFATWHSHHNAAVDEARLLLANRKVKTLHTVWHEDVDRWHPGQQWIWQAGGLGVFDAGSNAISILTKVLPERALVKSSTFVVEAGRAAPVAAKIALAIGDASEDLLVDLDWRVKQDQRFITITCEDGTELSLTDSGRTLHVDGHESIREANLEYPRLYERFKALIDSGSDDVDIEPMRVIADAFLMAQWDTVARTTS